MLKPNTHPHLARADRLLAGARVQEAREAVAQAPEGDATLTRLLEARLVLGETRRGRRPRPVPVQPAEGLLQAWLQAAADTLGRAASRHPDRADTRYHRAVALAATGEVAAASDDVTAALRINPAYADALHLADALAVTEPAGA